MTNDSDLELQRLLDAIFRHYHYDFRDYSQASLRRRLGQAVSRFGVSSLTALQERVLVSPELFSELLDYLTVQVSDLFRDPGYWAALRQHVVPMLRTYPYFKVWVAGCSSGEEAYSLAILLKEEGVLERALIYATDINPTALRAAEAGVYDLDRLAVFSENYRLAGGKASLSEHYTAGYGRAVFDRGLRAQMTFSDHCLATDSVFAEVELVSCRNVLIYFNRALQDRALGLFRDSLCRRGFLGLGSKESLAFSSFVDAFEPVAPRERVYRKRAE